MKMARYWEVSTLIIYEKDLCDWDFETINYFTNLRLLPPPTPITSPTITGTPIKVKALYDYEPTSPGDLGFKEGDIVTIHSTIDKVWWDGELNGQQGVVPANYVEIVS
jgi:hypothetical protein